MSSKVVVKYPQIIPIIERYSRYDPAKLRTVLEACEKVYEAALRQKEARHAVHEVETALANSIPALTKINRVIENRIILLVEAGKILEAITKRLRSVQERIYEALKYAADDPTAAMHEAIQSSMEVWTELQHVLFTIKRDVDSESNAKDIYDVIKGDLEVLSNAAKAIDVVRSLNDQEQIDLGSRKRKRGRKAVYSAYYDIFCAHGIETKHAGNHMPFATKLVRYIVDTTMYGVTELRTLRSKYEAEGNTTAFREMMTTFEPEAAKQMLWNTPHTGANAAGNKIFEAEITTESLQGWKKQCLAKDSDGVHSVNFVVAPSSTAVSGVSMAVPPTASHTHMKEGGDPSLPHSERTKGNDALSEWEGSHVMEGSQESHVGSSHVVLDRQHRPTAMTLLVDAVVAFDELEPLEPMGIPHSFSDDDMLTGSYNDSMGDNTLPKPIGTADVVGSGSIVTQHPIAGKTSHSKAAEEDVSDTRAYNQEHKRSHGNALEPLMMDVSSDGVRLASKTIDLDTNEESTSRPTPGREQTDHHQPVIKPLSSLSSEEAVQLLIALGCSADLPQKVEALTEPIDGSFLMEIDDIDVFYELEHTPKSAIRTTHYRRMLKKLQAMQAGGGVSLDLLQTRRPPARQTLLQDTAAKPTAVLPNTSTLPVLTLPRQRVVEVHDR